MKNRIYLSLLIVALLSIVSWTVYAQRSGSVKQTWDYKLIALNVDRGRITWMEDGVATSNLTIVSKSKELGDQGWELVSVTSWGENIFYWFKRPK